MNPHEPTRRICCTIDDARIFGGIHYRFDQEEAARQRRKVGRYILRHLLRPVHRGENPSCCPVNRAQLVRASTNTQSVAVMKR